MANEGQATKPKPSNPFPLIVRNEVEASQCANLGVNLPIMAMPIQGQNHDPRLIGQRTAVQVGGLRFLCKSKELLEVLLCEVPEENRQSLLKQLPAIEVRLDFCRMCRFWTPEQRAPETLQ